jgi:Leucine-rich repeat (LRR) protein
MTEIDNIDDGAFAEILRLVRTIDKTTVRNSVRAVSKRCGVLYDQSVKFMVLSNGPTPFPSDWSRFPALRKIDLSRRNDLLDLSPLSSCSTLTSLDMSACRNLSHLGPLASCKALESLDLSYCNMIKDISPLPASRPPSSPWTSLTPA